MCSSSIVEANIPDDFAKPEPIFYPVFSIYWYVTHVASQTGSCWCEEAGSSARPSSSLAAAAEAGSMLSPRRTARHWAQGGGDQTPAGVRTPVLPPPPGFCLETCYLKAGWNSWVNLIRCICTHMEHGTHVIICTHFVCNHGLASCLTVSLNNEDTNR